MAGAASHAVSQAADKPQPPRSTPQLPGAQHRPGTPGAARGSGGGRGARVLAGSIAPQSGHHERARAGRGRGAAATAARCNRAASEPDGHRLRGCRLLTRGDAGTQPRSPLRHPTRDRGARTTPDTASAAASETPGTGARQGPRNTALAKARTHGTAAGRAPLGRPKRPARSPADPQPWPDGSAWPPPPGTAQRPAPCSTGPSVVEPAQTVPAAPANRWRGAAARGCPPPRQPTAPAALPLPRDPAAGTGWRGSPAISSALSAHPAEQNCAQEGQRNSFLCCQG